MIVAMGILSVMLILTATVVGSTTVLGNSTSAEGRSKRAFEAAEAGLQATVYRLNMLAPLPNKCIGGPSSAIQTPSGDACAPYSQTLGNGASYTSWTTTTMSFGGSCAGSAVGSSASIAERCVTSAGTADGVTRRVQARVASYETAPPFPLAGVVGLSGVTIEEQARIVGPTGSNGTVSVGNNGSSDNVILGPAAPNPVLGGQANPGTVYRRTPSQGPFVFAPVDPGNSATVNDNGRITNGQANPRVSPFDSVTGAVTWDPAGRTLKLRNNASVTLGGGIYNFCSIEMRQGSTVTIAPGARTAIYIDSPEREGSGCAADTGTITMLQNSSFVNTSPPVAGTSFAHDPTALQLYVVGKSNTTLRIENNAAFYGTIYAPTSTVDLANNAGTWGAVSANVVKIKNNGQITGDPNAQNISISGGGIYFRTAWRECRSSSPTTDPSAGC